MKLSNQRDGQKLESKARFKPGEPSKSHEERTHDRYTEELNTEFRQWNLTKPLPPKVKLETLFGDPLEWLEWSGFFTATVHNANITKRNIMYHIKSYVSGKAKQILTGLSYDGSQYEHSWKLLSNLHGQPYSIIDSHYKITRFASNVKNCWRIEYVCKHSDRFWIRR